LGYRIYRRDRWTQSWESFLPVGNVTEYTVKGQPIDDWVFCIAALDRNGHESLINAYMPRPRADAEIKFLQR
jgi:hypothetical protein